VDGATLSSLRRQLDGLHEMIYRRGGIRPVNAAVEELSKLLLLELKLFEDPNCEVPGAGALSIVLDPDRIERSDDLGTVKTAFRWVVEQPDYAARVPGGGAQPIWPSDEPLRISRADVVAEALRILRNQLTAASTDGLFDVIGTAFDVFLRGRYSHAGGLGTHLTPHSVATALTRICLDGLDIVGQRSDGPVVGDPCCGTGRFLIAAVNELGLESDDPRRKHLLSEGLFGADQSTSSVAKARINLLLLGARRPNVFTVGDSVTDHYVDKLRGRLQLVLTNPPFGDGKYDSAKGIGRASRLLPALSGKKQIDPALAFVVRCLELLSNGGRLGIVLPDGLVDGPILRDALLSGSDLRMRDVSVEGAVSLPTVTFALGGTVAKTTALILRRQAAKPSQIFIARAEHVGYLKQGGASVADPAGDDLPAIAHAARGTLGRTLMRVPREVRFLSRRPLAALVPTDGTTTLDPGRIDPGAFAARAALSTTGTRFGDILSAVKRRQGSKGEDIPFVSVLHIDDLGAVAWHHAEHYRPSTPGLEAHPGDLIVSLLNPRKLRATVIPTDSGRVYCSSEFGVFEVDGDPYVALALLHHPLVKSQMAPLGRGTSSSRRRISQQDLLDLRVPRLPTRELREVAAAVRRSLEQLRSGSLDLASAYQAAASCPK